MLESPTTIQTVALYARVSTDEQREGQTIQSQIAELERFAAASQWPVSGIYKDEGWSGSVLARPDLDRLRDDASKSVFQAVVLNDVDRLARDVTHLGIIKRDLERHGVQVIFRKLPSSSSPTHNLMVNILGSFAEFERELIADRTRRGKRHKVEVLKQYVGSRPPFGYRYVPGDKRAGKNGYLEVDPMEAPVVRQMFQWVDIEGLSARRVLLRLNELRLPSRKGNPWAKSSVLRVLHSETYSGLWHFGKYQSYEPPATVATQKYRRHSKSSLRRRPRSEWLPVALPDNLRLVSPDVWKRVQKRLEQNVCFSPRNEKHLYLLKGLLWCGVCGRRYHGCPCHGRYYYRCAGRCKSITITEGRLNDAVWDAVLQALLDPTQIEAQVEQLHRGMQEQKSPTEAERHEIEDGLRHLQNEESRILEAYRLEVISSDQLRRELDKLKPRKAAMEERGANLAAILSKPRLPVIRRSIREYCDRAGQRIHGLDLIGRQRLLRDLIRSVTIEPQAIRIKGEIPLIAPPAPESVSQPPKGSGNVGCVETTTPRCCGLNAATEYLATFELRSTIPPIGEWWLKQIRGPKGHYVR